MRVLSLVAAVISVIVFLTGTASLSQLSKFILSSNTFTWLTSLSTLHTIGLGFTAAVTFYIFQSHGKRHRLSKIILKERENWHQQSNLAFLLREAKSIDRKERFFHSAGQLFGTIVFFSFFSIGNFSVNERHDYLMDISKWDFERVISNLDPLNEFNDRTEIMLFSDRNSFISSKDRRESASGKQLNATIIPNFLYIRNMSFTFVKPEGERVNFESFWVIVIYGIFAYFLILSLSEPRIKFELITRVKKQIPKQLSERKRNSIVEMFQKTEFKGDVTKKFITALVLSISQERT